MKRCTSTCVALKGDTGRYSVYSCAVLLRHLFPVFDDKSEYKSESVDLYVTRGYSVYHVASVENPKVDT